jgi:hypothetical protein
MIVQKTFFVFGKFTSKKVLNHFGLPNDTMFLSSINPQIYFSSLSFFIMETFKKLIGCFRNKEILRKELKK